MISRASVGVCLVVVDISRDERIVQTRRVDVPNDRRSSVDGPSADD